MESLFDSGFQSKKRTTSELELEAEEEEDLIDLTGEDSVEFKVIFPTMNTVTRSSVGPEGFGTLFCKRKDFESLRTESLKQSSCPSEIFHNCTTVGGDKCKYAMHSKIMTVSSPDPIYIYCGSHNFTASAWGKTTKLGAMLMINNFEVGVLIPAPKWTCGYPYLRPAKKYSEIDYPWDQTEYYGAKSK